MPKNFHDSFSSFPNDKGRMSQRKFLDNINSILDNSPDTVIQEPLQSVKGLIYLHMAELGKVDNIDQYTAALDILRSDLTLSKDLSQDKIETVRQNMMELGIKHMQPEVNKESQQLPLLAPSI